MNVQQFLEKSGVRFEVLDHRPTYNAQRLAQAVHVSGELVAKVVLLRADGQYVLAVLPATHTVDLGRVEDLLDADEVELASEEECGRKFSDCELGAMTPFGSRYGMKTLFDQMLAEDDEIVFEANAHNAAVRMECDDYMALEKPIVAVFAQHL